MSVREQAREILPTGTWHTDPVHSSLGFSVKHMGVGTFRGQFDEFAAKLDVTDGGEVALSGTAPVASIVTRDSKLLGHLLTPDFFDGDRHPQVSFEATDVSRNGDDISVDGALTLKGVTRPVTLHGTVTGPLADPFGGERLGVDLEGVIDRNEFGIEWNTPLPGGGVMVSDDVRLSAELELVKG